MLFGFRHGCELASRLPRRELDNRAAELFDIGTTCIVRMFSGKITTGKTGPLFSWIIFTSFSWNRSRIVHTPFGHR